MEYLRHDYMLIWIASEPLIVCLSCNEWRCGTYQYSWNEWNVLIDKYITKNQHAVKVQTQKNICGTVLLTSYPWVYVPWVSIEASTNSLHLSLSMAMVLVCHTLFWHHSLMSSSHSLVGVPRLLSPSIMPKIVVLISLWSGILQMWPKNFNFLCMTDCTMFFFVLSTMLTLCHTSLFDILWNHLMFSEHL